MLRTMPTLGIVHRTEAVPAPEQVDTSPVTSIRSPEYSVNAGPLPELPTHRSLGTPAPAS